MGQRRVAARYQEASRSEQESIAAEVQAQRPEWSTDRIHAILQRRAPGLIRAAEEELDRLPVPDDQTVLVHDDLCGGNAVWTSGESVTIVDWDGAGAGQAGLDIGNLRFEGSLHFGVGAASEILSHWRQATGRHIDGLRYWDLTAALNTPADLTRWAPTLSNGTERRDAFLRAALDGELD